MYVCKAGALPTVLSLKPICFVIHKLHLLDTQTSWPESKLFVHMSHSWVFSHSLQFLMREGSRREAGIEAAWRCGVEGGSCVKYRVCGMNQNEVLESRMSLSASARSRHIHHVGDSGDNLWVSLTTCTTFSLWETHGPRARQAACCSQSCKASLVPQERDWLKMLESSNGETRMAGRHFQRTVRCKGLYSSSPEFREHCEVAIAWSSGAL